MIPDFDANRSRVELGARSRHDIAARGVTVGEAEGDALRVRASLFGFNAPHPLTLSNDVRSHYGFTDGSDWTFTIAGQTIDLDTTYPGILANSWLVLSEPTYQELYRATSVIEAAQAKYTLAGKTTRVALDTNENLDLFRNHYRETMVFGQSELLEYS